MDIIAVDNANIMRSINSMPPKRRRHTVVSIDKLVVVWSNEYLKISNVYDFTVTYNSGIYSNTSDGDFYTEKRVAIILKHLLKTILHTSFA